MGATAAIVSSVSTGVGGFVKGQQEAKALQRQGAYDAAAYTVNADIAARQAVDAKDRGFQEEQKSRLATAQTGGAQRAYYAAQGISPDSGSADNVQTSTRALGELDALTIRNNAAREAWGFQVESSDFLRKAALAKDEGTNAAAAARANGWMSLVAGGTKAIDTFGNRSRRTKAGSAPTYTPPDD